MYITSSSLFPFLFLQFNYLKFTFSKRNSIPEAAIWLRLSQQSSGWKRSLPSRSVVDADSYRIRVTRTLTQSRFKILANNSRTFWNQYNTRIIQWNLIPYYSGIFMSVALFRSRWRIQYLTMSKNNLLLDSLSFSLLLWRLANVMRQAFKYYGSLPFRGYK